MPLTAGFKDVEDRLPNFASFPRGWSSSGTGGRLEEALAAEAAGADLIASTLSGYTPYSRKLDGPDFKLIRNVAARLHTPIIVEGCIVTPEDAPYRVKIQSEREDLFLHTPGKPIPL
jgi:hypothetical protein